MNKDWTSLCPPYDSQYSATTHSDMQDCVEESLCHILFMLTGKRYSPRALGYNVDVAPDGSNMFQATKAVKTKGVTLYDFWATPDSFTWESYYQTPPPFVLGLVDRYNIQILRPDLNISPLWTVLRFPNGAQHAVAQINDTQYFDSEAGNPIKPLDYGGAVVVSQVSIQISPILIMTDNLYVKTINFSTDQLSSFTPEVQAAIKFNDNGGKNVIYNGEVVVKDPNFVYP